MTSTQLTHHPIPGYSDRRHRVRTGRHGGSFSLHPVIEATGWILVGAGIGSIAIIAGVWALMRFTTFEDTSVVGPMPVLAQHHVVRSIN